ncbi:hypothetical protein GUJ93_ZPchr0598g33636 [Zizania palustris]|uniref:Uncharacterized protein n=1 Tax=Zizania palustris TaxID=103762 RepID=A0A8J5RB55_ZIZPA|nr:hypothetical protein GUJ93_ZPchr0598g33636 [Zizania palustris]
MARREDEGEEAGIEMMKPGAVAAAASLLAAELSPMRSRRRDRLKIGTGAANNADRRKAKGQLVEVVILIAHTSSDLSCWMENCSSTQVLHFEDLIPCPMSQSFFDVLWDNVTFARVDIAIHTYQSKNGRLLNLKGILEGRHLSLHCLD